MELYFFRNFSILGSWGVQYAGLGYATEEVHSLSIGPRIYYPVLRGVKLYALVGLEKFFDVPTENYSYITDNTDRRDVSGYYYHIGTKLHTRLFPMFYLNGSIGYFSEWGKDNDKFTRLTSTVGIGVRIGGYKSIN